MFQSGLTGTVVCTIKKLIVRVGSFNQDRIRWLQNVAKQISPQYGAGISPWDLPSFEIDDEYLVPLPK
jgi:hypothetical protein